MSRRGTEKVFLLSAASGGRDVRPSVSPSVDPAPSIKQFVQPPPGFSVGEEGQTRPKVVPIGHCVIVE